MRCTLQYGIIRSSCRRSSCCGVLLQPALAAVQLRWLASHEAGRWVSRQRCGAGPRGPTLHTAHRAHQLARCSVLLCRGTQVSLRPFQMRWAYNISRTSMSTGQLCDRFLQPHCFADPAASFKISHLRSQCRQIFPAATCECQWLNWKHCRALTHSCIAISSRTLWSGSPPRQTPSKVDDRSDVAASWAQRHVRDSGVGGTVCGQQFFTENDHFLVSRWERMYVATLWWHRMQFVVDGESIYWD